MLLDDSSCQVLLPTLASFMQLVPFTRKVVGLTVSCSLCRLVAKIAAGKVKEELTSLLAPQQLGFGIK